MEVHFTPKVQARLDQLRGTLDSRYDDIKSGKVKLIPGSEVVARLRAKSAARRTLHS